ncbi:type IX secretion system membrane protein PorP/SprF [Aurantibacillus circumpalustris]|uniref:type IX secretion system membrane protein PorP/SprF n=1 Tax=Aurantibacillus circumpalustris TaxID=3036359 RepID=UPI00295B8863|nr:type IX secretion system membrane protein PorP/SprF [Aurantibacillus circumpalustris]
MLKKFCLIILLACFSKKSSAQGESNVPYQSLVAINPSFAGSNGLLRNQTFAQTPIEALLNSFSINNVFDAYLTSLKSGVAFTARYYERSLNYSSSTGSFSFAKYFTVKQNLNIIPSIQVGYTTNQINEGYNANTVFLQPGTNSNWVSAGYFSLNGGLLINYKNFYGGVSVFNMNRPDVGIYSEQKTNPLFKIHASYNLRLSDNWLFNLYGQYSTQKKYENQSVTINALILKHLIYGVGYRWRDAAFMNVGCRTNYFVVQLVYNKNSSSPAFSESNQDYWQFIMSFNLRNKEQRNSITNFEAW